VHCCCVCGTAFVPPINAPGKKYCTRRCNLRAFRQRHGIQQERDRKKAARNILRAQEEARKEVLRLAREARRQLAASLATDRTSKDCAICHGALDLIHRARKYCGAKCAKVAVRRSPSGRARKAAERVSRRRHGAERERVDPVSILERDGWQCQICGSDTPRSLRGSNDPCAPEVDHIVPLALGGRHAASNLQCACRRCNGKKGASNGMEQAVKARARVWDGMGQTAPIDPSQGQIPLLLVSPL